MSQLYFVEVLETSLVFSEKLQLVTEVCVGIFDKLAVSWWQFNFSGGHLESRGSGNCRCLVI